MSTYKNSIIDLSPVCFITFDGDTLYNPGDGQLIYKHITDESNNNNNATLQTNQHDSRRSYLMGQPSLVQRANIQDEACIIFAPYSYDNSGLTDYAFEKSLVEILHTDSLRLNEDYTIMFHFNKKTSEHELRKRTYDYTQNKYILQTNHNTFKRTIFKKGSVIGLTYIDYWSGYDYIKVDFPGYSWESTVNEAFPGGDFFDKNWHFTLTHKIVSVSPGVFKNVRRVYIDGILVHENVGNLLTRPYTADNTSPIEIAGNRDGTHVNTLNDRQTSPLKIDQFAVFDKCLTHNEIVDVYKKTVDYVKFIEKSIPSLYIRLDDSDIDTSTTIKSIYPTNTNIYGTWSKPYPSIEKKVLIDTNRIGYHHGCAFKNAMAKINTNNYETPINASGDFTLEFWASFSGSERGVLFSCQSNIHPYRGILVESNRLHEEDEIGMIQVRIDDRTFLPCTRLEGNGERVSYNDGRMRHYAITRKGTRLSLYIDGGISNFIDMDDNTIIDSTHGAPMYLMGQAPGDINVVGTMGHIAFYNRSLAHAEIQARAYFTAKMLLRGKITLQGSPTKAQLRVYEHNTGELINEYETNELGEYSINVYTNRYIDVVALDKNDQTVKPRIYGPILAHEYQDN